MQNPDIKKILLYMLLDQNEIPVKMTLTWFDSQFPLSPNPNQ